MSVGREGRQRAFTLVELLVAMAVLSILCVLLLQVTDSTFKLWRSTVSSITMFENARAAFDVMTRRISQGTVNTYLDYYDATWTRRDPANAAAFAAFVPAKYGRASDLHFLSGGAATILAASVPENNPGHGVFFFAPLGYTDTNSTYSDLPNLLNACGYYVEWGDDSKFQPAFLQAANFAKKSRFRLIENIQAAQSFVNYPALSDASTANDRDWIINGLKPNTTAHVLAENIIALIIRPELPEQDAKLITSTWNAWDLTADYICDSRNDNGRKRANLRNALQFAQLPPMLRVVMVAVDESSAARLIGSATTVPAGLKLPATAFIDPSKLNADLDALAAQLVAAKVQFRIFNQVIPLRGAKFSAGKEN